MNRSIQTILNENLYEHVLLLAAKIMEGYIRASPPNLFTLF